MIAPPPQAVDIAPAAAVYADSLLREAVGVAVSQVWHSTVTPDIYVYTTNRPGDIAWGYGGTAGAEIYFSRAYRDGWWRRYTDTGQPADERRGALEEVCETAAHEEGHVLGLGHIPGTIMAPIMRSLPSQRGLDDPDLTTEPVACKHWARLKLATRYGRGLLARLGR